jgi:hypothetical protein
MAQGVGQRALGNRKQRAFDIGRRAGGQVVDLPIQQALRSGCLSLSATRIRRAAGSPNSSITGGRRPLQIRRRSASTFSRAIVKSGV